MIARVFPRRTDGTPDDVLAFTRMPQLQDFALGITQVHVSVAFTYDIALAEQMAAAWEAVAPVTMGGPAFRKPAGEFTPGMYLRKGYVITSRGCPNRCTHCSVHVGNPKVMELPIRDGWILQDDNLLACSEPHIRSVFAMLGRQKRRAEFTGGLEAHRMRDWHVSLLDDLRPRTIYFAYDDPADWDPLYAAVERLRQTRLMGAGHIVCCYVLCGYPGDTLIAAEMRMRKVVGLGVTPAAMLFRDDVGKVDRTWKRFQRQWFRPSMIWARHKQEAGI